MSLSRIVVSGIVSSEPEKRFTPNNNIAVTNFLLAVPSLANKSAGAAGETIQIKVTCWRQLADAAVEQVRAEDIVLIEGKLMINTYQSPDGTQKKAFEIDASTISKLSGVPQALLVASAAPSSGVGAKTPAYVSSQVARAEEELASVKGAPYSDFSEQDLFTEDDIPF